jgi:glycosyltransferase involved in cell wall biosynthesis
MRTSLIISTYEKPAYLDLVLTSVAWQIEKPWEIIVADDGSNLETTRVVSRWRKRSIFKLIHMFQPDDGFRLSRSRNLSSVKASGDLLIFVDGDCLLPRDFVTEIKSLYRPGVLIFGSRKLLTNAETNDCIFGRLGQNEIQRLFSGRKFIKLNLGVFRHWPHRSWKNVRGFMMVAGRHDVMALGGFDESFDSWGLEDSDFAVRASRFGLKFLDSRYKTSLVHLHHSEPNKMQKSKNAEEFKSLLSDANRILPSKTSIREEFSS